MTVATFPVAFVKIRENYLSRKLKIHKPFSWKVIYTHWSNSSQIRDIGCVFANLGKSKLAENWDFAGKKFRDVLKKLLTSKLSDNKV